MTTSTRRAIPAPVRALARTLTRLALGLGRRGPLKRHMRRLRFGPWAARWLSGSTIVGWRGIRVEVDPGEAHGFHVFVHGDYGGAELDACITHCRSARVFVDVGAHIGLISLATARACPALTVVAVEANPDVARWFRGNVGLNPDLAARVTLLEAAATGQDGEVAFAESDEPTNIGTGHVVGESSRHDRRVPAVALGAWLAAKGLSADVVKMDVEGGELPALDGLWATGRKPQVILLETHGHMSDSADAFNARVLEALHRHDYDVERLDRGRWTLVANARVLGDRSHVRARLRVGGGHAPL